MALPLTTKTQFRIGIRVFAGLCLAAAVAAVGFLLTGFHVVFNPMWWISLQAITGFLSFSIAANVLVRFLGTGNRTALLLGSGFALSGIIPFGGIAAFYVQRSDFPGRMQPPLSLLAWMIAETLIALLLLGTFSFEEQLPWPRQPKGFVFAATSVVVVAAYVVGITFLAVPTRLAIRPGGILPRPGDLMPAFLFFAAAVVLYRNRDKIERGLAFDSMLIIMAALNAVCHFIACESAQPFDVPAMAGEVINTGSFVLLMSATLVDNVRLFGEVQDRARRDSLTGLANYRTLMDLLHSEIERSGRTHRPFSVLLMDLDGLKEINDQHGHLTGSRALCRVAEVLRLYCRSVDTAARYGGDEFALVLPETDEPAAQQVTLRIEGHLLADAETPRLSVSTGTATYPQDGATVQQLLETADRELYSIKARSKQIKKWRQMSLEL